MTPAPPRILHLIDTGGPGGAETVFAQLATGLPQLGFESTAVVSRDAWLAARLRAGGVEPRFLRASGSLDLGYLRGIVTLIRSERPALLMTHLLGPAVYGSLAGMLTGTPMISVLHGQSDLGPQERFRAAKAAVIRRGARRVIFVSDQLRADIAPRLGLEESVCAVIPNGVDVDRVQQAPPAPLRAVLGLANDALLVGAVGNLRRPKAYDVLLRATRIAHERKPRLRLVIAGDTSVPLYEELLALRRELGLDGIVHFLGLRDDVPSVLKALDAYVLSSTTEGFSIALCEAMAAGVPVLATRSGGPEQILDGGRYGVLVPPADPAALAAGMVTLAESTPDRRQLTELAAHRVADQYGIDAMLSSYVALLKAAVSDD